ncbi:hypothetical protein ABFS82_11G025200 [Erythranthe guttata]|uniref:Syntaxin 6/10/61 N-terminal domain-containing protein n=1 Tax=Erythranthe guttata TaxID=4155 RepID=A0A022PZI1_ERYGU|nr:PREDICTED: uncharacterized protein LOC105976754 [Erythranthe guttata]XP_012857472.1 PREDICTED: uncharacterized protein LOC105976754 [Erythranthe guttata]EYU20909.1 hypothetical protein MIMGU_mgv1a010895mg [Erythranthe guttata]EYU20910.1 hypothetical protein MIMGU_mgv1a010895mg [Erythranthe guttata]|eukprot:XP_012857471.1 PREDICTED: uncharacterized protein LOC105976754 [Erythranthe guttata]
MLVGNSFDLWQKDTFFPAAEEVQQSADIMESAYRTWLRARKEGSMPLHLDELGRELQMALGTAKWQLEEFEKAVRLSYRNSGDDITITRHRQFLSVIEDQISRVEIALKEALDVEGKKPFRWVNLDEEECDDLALFLSGAPQRRIKDEDIIKMGAAAAETSSRIFGSDVSPKVKTQNLSESSKEINCYIELQEKKNPEISCEERVALEIVVDNDNRQSNALVEVTPKEKGFRPFFWRSRGGNCTHMRLINWMNRHLGGGYRSQRQQHVSQVMPIKSIRFILVLMLTVFLVVPFLVYST